MTTTNDIVAKLWNLCHVLRDDGTSFHQYVTELTYLLFLKMAQETGTEGRLPEGWRWSDLKAKDGTEQLTFYREMLIHLGAEASGKVQAIYANANTSLRRPRNLGKLVKSIDALDWYSARHEGLGDLYEGLLEKNANESKSGAGQYFTPRALIEAMVDITKPRAGEILSDPAAGTLGFITHADRYIKSKTDDLFDLSEAEQVFQRKEAYYAIELVPDTQRLALMNALLHDIDSEIILGDTLSPVGSGVPKSDVILTNPPFGTKKGGGRPTRDDFTFPTSNKQLAFLQHIYRNLKPGGRAAVVLPDGVLTTDSGNDVRSDLMEKCDLHTILRLPTGIFYAQGVKTNVLFFRKGDGKDSGNTGAVWIYDLRTNMPSFGKRTPFTRAHLQPFVEAYGDDPNGGSPRFDEGEDGRFRSFSREFIAKRGDDLDITWLRDESVEHAEDLLEPDGFAAEIVVNLQAATAGMERLMEALDGDRSTTGDGDGASDPSPISLPVGWVETDLATVLLDVRNGTTATQNKEGEGVPVTRIESIQAGGVDHGRVGFIAEPDDLQRFAYSAGDIAFSHINSYEHVGKVGLIRESDLPLLAGMNLLRLRAASGIDPAWLFWMLSSPQTRNAVRRGIKRAVNQVSINQKKLGAVPVPLPPVGEQRRIVAKIDELLDELDAAGEALDTVCVGSEASANGRRLGGLLSKLNQSILAKAFRGELVSQDPNDEPASVLLERIRAERETSGAKPQKRGRGPSRRHG